MEERLRFKLRGAEETDVIRRQVSRSTSVNGRNSIRPAQLTSTSHRP